MKIYYKDTHMRKIIQSIIKGIIITIFVIYLSYSLHQLSQIDILAQKEIPQNEYTNTISMNNLLTNATEVNSYIVENNTLEDTSGDPWVLTSLDKLAPDAKPRDIKNITIYVSDLSTSYIAAQLYFLPSYTPMIYNLREGRNVIDVSSYMSDDIEGIRFDFTTAKGTSITIDKISINDTSYELDMYKHSMEQKLHIQILICIIVILTILSSLIKLPIINNSFGFKKSWINSIFSPQILIIALIFSGTYMCAKEGMIYLALILSVLPVLLSNNGGQSLSKKGHIVNRILYILFTLVVYIYMYGLIQSYDILANANLNNPTSQTALFLVCMSFCIWISSLSVNRIFAKTVEDATSIKNTVNNETTDEIVNNKVNDNDVSNSDIKDIPIEIKKHSIKKNTYNHGFNTLADNILCSTTIIFSLLIVFEFIIVYLGDGLGKRVTLVNIFTERIYSSSFLLSFVLCLVSYMLLSSLIGKGISNILFYITYGILLIGNIVKLTYHNTLLKPSDFLSLKEFFIIIPSVIGTFKTVLLIVLAVIAIILLIVFRKKLIKYIKPHLRVDGIIVLSILFIYFIVGLNKTEYLDININNYQPWVDEYTIYKEDGLFVYNYYNLADIKNIYPKKPAHYNSSYMASLSSDLNTYSLETVDNQIADTTMSSGLTSNVNTSHNSSTNKGDTDNQNNDEKPTIILVMFESLMDLDNIPGLSLNQNVDSTIDKYTKGHVISPFYGGGTAACEYEALTGFSNLFYTDGIVPYSTYMNNPSEYIPSIVGVFNDNGYETSMIHPNVANFYNRSTAYECFRFNNYINCDNSFDNADTTSNGFVLNSSLLDRIKEQLDSSDEPQFIFTITIESHSPYITKYTDIDGLTANMEGISEDSLDEMSKYAYSVKSNDNMLKELIDYMNHSDKPMILYGFGDHLPPLQLFMETDYLNDPINHYETPFIVYSNYKDIEIDTELMSESQIATEILKNSELSYPAYFDYIYSLRSDYPITQKQFVQYDKELKNKRLDIYWDIQYDLMFGNQYLLNNK